MSGGGSSLAVSALIWQRFPEGDGTLHTSIEINSGPHLSKLFNVVQDRYHSGKVMSFHHPRHLSLGKGFGSTAISSFYDPIYKHTVIIGSNNEQQPMKYFSLDDFYVFIPKDHDNFDFSNYDLTITGNGYT